MSVGPARLFCVTGRGVRRGRAGAATLFAVLALTAACAFGPPPADQGGAPPNLPAPSVSAGPDSGDQELAVTVLAKKLDVPWGIAFLPDGAALVTERDTGRILRVGPGTDRATDGLTVTEVRRLSEVSPGGDAGLLGIAVSPKYKTDKTVFIYYSTDKDNRVAKLVLKGMPQPILTGLPRSLADNGGALAFGPDGFLYVGTGDGTSSGNQAANPKSLGGKILRITAAGKPAPGNPGKNSPIWASGFRNVQGFAWDASKRMYASESNQKTYGELNLIQKGRNYGFPAVEGTGTDAKLTNPLASWPIAESSCSGVAVLERTVATACLLGQRVWFVGTTANGTVLGQPQAILNGEFGRLRGMATAPDGSFWVSTSNQEEGGNPAPDDDRLIRLVLSDGGAGRS